MAGESGTPGTVVAALFPGQGAQRVGMGAELLESEPMVRAAFERAGRALGYDLAAFCAGGPADELSRTCRAQPALFTLGVGIWRAMEERGVRAACAAGHSIGEFAAWVVAGALDFEQGLMLVQKRAELMERAATRHSGAMSAVLGLADQEVEEICQRVEGPCQPAAYNCPRQVVISGETRAVESAERLAGQAGAKTVRLGVSAAFHSRLMEEADERFRFEVDAAELRDAEIPVAANASGLLVTKAEEIRSAMRKQMLSPVQWETGIRALLGMSADVLVEAGPGAVLTGLLRRIDRRVKGVCVQDRASFEDAVGIGTA